jgi:hypothetical protein
MTIQCKDLAQFIAICAGLVREGTTYRANGDTLVITLLGGF